MSLRSALSAPAMSVAWRVQASRGSLWSGVSGLSWSREAAAVVLFCAVGILLSIWMMLSLPQSDEMATFLVQVL